MANRRMFSKTVVCSSKFLRMPATSRLLYYDLGMASDDDGYCEWFPVLQMTGAKEQDMEVLHANGLVYVFDKEVLVVKDWKENNFIRSDRYQPSKYVGKYENMLGLPYGIPTVDPGKDRVGEDINTISVAIAPQITIEKEIPEKRESGFAPAKYPNAKEVFRLFKGYSSTLWDRNTTFLRAAQALYEDKGIEELSEQMTWYKKNRTKDFCPQFDDPAEWANKYASIDRFFDKITT